ncbi:glucose-fructose oxidoreductase domain-containing protein 1 [Lates japonicus]|uniref:Glucose-fructose oxidoreductase domain-containing protein 1 n=1 Tax=Lates japonicus TaxID=270547 RepID=A0AAD3NMX1_LATJO|nr:glucose-fructose oxidoreductase domain-containing protein 1 [Lates japonicus]
MEVVNALGGQLCRLLTFPDEPSVQQDFDFLKDLRQTDELHRGIRRITSGDFCVQMVLEGACCTVRSTSTSQESLIRRCRREDSRAVNGLEDRDLCELERTARRRWRPELQLKTPCEGFFYRRPSVTFDLRISPGRSA